MSLVCKEAVSDSEVSACSQDRTVERRACSQDPTVGCPNCCADREPTLGYVEWLALADRAIERGLNANAVWRLHERHGRNHHGHEYDLGGES